MALILNFANNVGKLLQFHLHFIFLSFCCQIAELKTVIILLTYSVFSVKYLNVVQLL
jgi:hypothetical protein